MCCSEIILAIVPAILPPQIPMHGDHYQHWNNKQGRQYLRQYKIGFCIDAHDLQCIYLFTHSHVTQFTGYFASHYTCQYNTNKCGSKLKDNGVANDLCDRSIWE